MNNVFGVYDASRDYAGLKFYLDQGYKIITVWIHNTTLRPLVGIAEKVAAIPGGVDGDWYSIDCWNYFPTINKESFEDFCKSKDFFYILPHMH